MNREKGEFPEERKVIHYDNQRLIGEILEGLSSNDRSIVEQTTYKTFSISAYIKLLKNDDRTYYLACPNDDCKKKVIEESVGWRC